MSGLGRAFAAAQARYDNMATPDWADADESTSAQPLGDTSVLVSFVVEDGAANVTGAWINAEFVEAAEFSTRRIEAWERDIKRELDDDAADHAECARLQADMDREDAA